MDKRIAFEQLDKPKTGWEAIASTAERDKTAVAPVASSLPKLYWEKPRPDYPSIKAKPFISELQQEAIRRQKEAEPQSGHVEHQFFPAMGVLKGIRQTVGVIRGKPTK